MFKLFLEKPCRQPPTGPAVSWMLLNAELFILKLWSTRIYRNVQATWRGFWRMPNLQKLQIWRWQCFNDLHLTITSIMMEFKTKPCAKSRDTFPETNSEFTPENRLGPFRGELALSFRECTSPASLKNHLFQRTKIVWPMDQEETSTWQRQKVWLQRWSLCFFWGEDGEIHNSNSFFPAFGRARVNLYLGLRNNCNRWLAKHIYRLVPAIWSHSFLNRSSHTSSWMHCVVPVRSAPKHRRKVAHLAEPTKMPSSTNPEANHRHHGEEPYVCCWWCSSKVLPHHKHRTGAQSDGCWNAKGIGSQHRDLRYPQSSQDAG